VTLASVPFVPCVWGADTWLGHTWGLPDGMEGALSFISEPLEGFSLASRGSFLSSRVAAATKSILNAYLWQF
jgi:hypothetical protein